MLVSPDGASPAQSEPPRHHVVLPPPANYQITARPPARPPTLTTMVITTFPRLPTTKSAHSHLHGDRLQGRVSAHLISAACQHACAELAWAEPSPRKPNQLLPAPTSDTWRAPSPVPAATRRWIHQCSLPTATVAAQAAPVVQAEPRSPTPQIISRRPKHGCAPSGGGGGGGWGGGAPHEGMGGGHSCSSWHPPGQGCCLGLGSQTPATPPAYWTKRTPHIP